MDEILIEEKKFVSSKRAAKMTGYAKDYIGQLCREGRVPARLIGRSWYVLEAAIQDHRFGAEEPERESKTAQSPMKSPEIQSTWESPRYESYSEELLPAIKPSKEAESSVVDTEEEASQRIQDSWKAWFDRFDHMAEDDALKPIVVPMVSEEIQEESEESEKEPETERTKEEITMQVPIHTMSSRPLYRPPQKEFLLCNEDALPSIERITRRKSDKWLVRTIRIAGTVFAILAIIVAVAGSGYFDAYILSNSQVRIIAGVALYNK